VRRWLCRLIDDLNSWHTVYIVASIVLIILLLVALEYLTRTRPLHMVWR
jgi:hypothetical protein